MRNQIQIIILAAGIGKRMKSSLPKVLIPFRGRPMIKYLLDSVKRVSFSNKPVIVVGKGAALVKKTLGPDYIYIKQPKQLGTGQAVARTKKYLKGKAKNILVLYGDHPMVSAKTISQVADTHLKSGKVLTLAVVKVKDFNGWRQPLYHFGRIVRDNQGKIKEIVELKDCTETQKKITEINPSYFCFQANWLWQNIDKLKNNNAQQEYYLTDLVGMAIKQGYEIAAVPINPREALGINTQKQLLAVERI